jgi:hypothetical protein
MAAVRYYFDHRDWDGLFVDEEGIELRSIEAVQKEATESMTVAMREVLRWPLRAGGISHRGARRQGTHHVHPFFGRD